MINFSIYEGPENLQSETRNLNGNICDMYVCIYMYYIYIHVSGIFYPN
jgi:hypothetical protein